MKTKKHVLILASALLILIAALFAKTPYNFQNGEYPVVISICCDAILSNYDKLEDALQEGEYVPEDGVILSETTVHVKNGSTVLDVLKKITEEQDIQMEYSQTMFDSYVEGINYIYEFSCGELSGWMYKVNGKAANQSCSSYKVDENDVIEWVYTCDLGRDLGDI